MSASLPCSTLCLGLSKCEHPRLQGRLVVLSLFYHPSENLTSFSQTKHFQTLFWTPDVRLVDCPGLVMPDLMPMEMQVSDPDASTTSCLFQLSALGFRRHFTYFAHARYPALRFLRVPASPTRARFRSRAPNSLSAAPRG